MSPAEVIGAPDGPGRSLRKLRRLAGVGLCDAAHAVGMCVPALHRAEDGDCRLLTVREVFVLSRVYADALKSGGAR